MGYAVLAFDGADKTRRAAAMDRHRAVISRWAEDGRMPFGTPLFTVFPGMMKLIVLFSGAVSISTGVVIAIFSDPALLPEMKRKSFPNPPFMLPPSIGPVATLSAG